jgi:hypothetical protein
MGPTDDNVAFAMMVLSYVSSVETDRFDEINARELNIYPQGPLF